MAYSDDNNEIKAVLEMIRTKRITPQEGHLRLQQLKQKESKESQAPLRVEDNQTDKVNKSRDIAIIGMSGRFPGADNLNTLWDHLSQGKSAITEVPKERWDIERYYDPDPAKLDKTNSRWGGFLADADQFDPLFFNISGMEAEVMDPQQRLFLEESWSALEDAGYANDSISGRACGVYVGAAPRDYLNHIAEKEVPASAQVFWGNTGSILASRISYHLNLKGPAITLDTACSSSLVAIHLACQGLLTGEVDMAIAGGVWVCTTPHYYVMTSNAGMLSQEGKCRAFDNGADGIVNGEGVGAVVLKSLERALEEGDYIHGVIKSSGINQDGKTNGITAPSSLSQAKLELDVYARAQINPETITYVEAHGTGTKLGDPIEIEALNQSFRTYTDQKQFCAIGSVKTNIGHACMAAGVASLIKLVLALKNKQIPPSLHFENENEHIRLKESPFYVNTALQDWKGHEGLRRGAVSSFGLSGTNVHMVVDEFLDNKQSTRLSPFYLAAFSAKTPALLERRLENFLEWSRQQPDAYTMSDICYSLNACRKHFQYRAAFVVTGQQDLNQQLKAFLEKGSPIMQLAGEQPEARQVQQWMSELNHMEPTDPRYADYLHKLGAFYRSGKDPDWAVFYGGDKYYKVPLPTYPFARESYWIEGGEQEADTAPEAVHSFQQIHPLVDENISSLKEQKFQTLVKGNSLLTNCTWQRESFIPAGCYVEMALSVGVMSGEKKIKRIEELVCVQPMIEPGGSQSLHTRLYPVGEDCYAEIAVMDGAEEQVCMQAKLIYEQDSSNAVSLNRVDVHSIKAGCELTMEQEAYYAYLLRHHDYQYSGAFQAIRQVSYRTDKPEALGEWTNPDEAKPVSGPDRFVLHPACIEACYQLGLLLTQLRDGKGEYDFAGFEVLDIHNPLAEEGFIHVLPSGYGQAGREDTRYYTITLINPDGRIAFVIDRLAIRRFRASEDTEQLKIAIV